MGRLRFIFVLLFAICNTGKAAFDWGVGTLIFNLNHYRGSNQHKTFVLPIPYFKYKTEQIEAEPSFVHGTVYKRSRFSLLMSVIAGPNVESKENHAREGMASLGYTVELGPKLIYHLWDADDGSQYLSLEWPVRRAYATNLRYLRPIGYTSIIYLNYVLYPRKNTDFWHIEFSIGPMFASRNYNNYFYRVGEEDQTSNRGRYLADSGYSGMQYMVIANRRCGHFYVVPFVRYDSLHGAVFRGSPLLKNKNYLAAGSGVFYLF